MNNKESVVKMDDKLDTRSLDVEDVEKQKLKSVFPQCFEEGKLNVERLLTLCGKYSDEKDHEKYNFEWKGKQQAYQLAAKRTMATLRPCKEESVNFDETGNLYIEGDNLEVIKVLQKSYYNKIKMIYIDPPYNTGHDFVYNDDFKDPLDHYKEITSQTTKSNPESMGRFHTAWLNMMLPRLRLAANLLREDGVIFISIDDHEVHNLRKICDEVFGEENFVAQIIVKSNPGGRDYGGIALTHDYLLCYGKNSLELNLILDKDKTFSCKDEIGDFDIRELRNRNIKFNDQNRPNLCYPFYLNENNVDENGLYELSLEPKPNYKKIMPLISQGVQTVWRWGQDKARENLNVNVKGKKKQDGTYMIVEKYRNALKRERSIWDETSVRNEAGSLVIKELFESKPFDYPKSLSTIKRAISLGTDTDGIVLDFFSGSATTAHAVMELNKEDGGNRKFIMVQLPELCDEKSEAFKAGYKNICEIGKERIRRAGQKLLEKDNQMSFEENKKPLDVGFKVFKLDSSNLEAWDSSPIDKETYDNYEQLKIEMTKRFDKVLDRIKSDRTDLDVVYEIMFKLGIEPTEKITKMDFDGKTVYSVREDCLLLICLDNDMKTETVEKMAEFSPAYMVFSQHCFKDVSSMSNIKLLLKRKKIDMKFI